jgi:hypothetical protein
MQLALGLATLFLAAAASCADLLTVFWWLFRAGGHRKDRYWLFGVYGLHWLLCFAVAVVAGVLLKRSGSWVLDRACSGLLFSATLVGVFREVSPTEIRDGRVAAHRARLKCFGSYSPVTMIANAGSGRCGSSSLSRRCWSVLCIQSTLGCEPR